MHICTYCTVYMEKVESVGVFSVEDTMHFGPKRLKTNFFLQPDDMLRLSPS